MLSSLFLLAGVALRGVHGATQSISPSLSPLKLSGTTIDKINTQYGENKSIPIIELYNFKSDAAIAVLSQLVSLDTELLDDETNFQFVKNSATNDQVLSLRYADNGRRVSEPDVSIVYIHKNMLFDDNIVLQQVQIALEAILIPSTTANSSVDRKKCLIVVYNGPIQSQDATIKLVNEAIGSMDVILSRKIEKLNVEVSLINVKNGKITQEDKATFNSKLAPLSESAMKLKDFSLAQPKTVASSSRVDSLGLSAALQASSDAFEWARSAVKPSISKIQKNELDFPTLVRNLVEDAIEVYSGLLAGTTVSWMSNKIGRDELTISIYEMMAPFYKRFVAVIRQDVTNRFNRVITDEMELTVHLMRDMRAIRDRFLSEFSARIAKLRPASKMPSSWAGQFEVHLFRVQLDEYLASRETEAKIQGVLSRGRKPVAVSLHWLVNHAFGRDYKQDVIGSRRSDRLVFDPVTARQRDVLLTPSRARALLPTSTSPATREFVREMLMFPLSVKNPVVPVVGGRRSKTAKRSSMPKRSDKRESSGPERFIRWDLPPLDVSKAKLDSALEKGGGASMLDGFLNAFPYFGDGFYKEPVISYGEDYEPQKTQK